VYIGKAVRLHRSITIIIYVFYRALHRETKAPSIILSAVFLRSYSFLSSQPDAANKQYPSVQNHKSTAPVSPAAELCSLETL